MEPNNLSNQTDQPTETEVPTTTTAVSHKTAGAAEPDETVETNVNVNVTNNTVARPTPSPNQGDDDDVPHAAATLKVSDSSRSMQERKGGAEDDADVESEEEVSDANAVEGVEGMEGMEGQSTPSSSNQDDVPRAPTSMSLPDSIGSMEGMEGGSKEKSNVEIKAGPSTTTSLEAKKANAASSVAVRPTPSPYQDEMPHAEATLKVSTSGSDSIERTNEIGEDYANVKIKEKSTIDETDRNLLACSVSVEQRQRKELIASIISTPPPHKKFKTVGLASTDGTEETNEEDTSKNNEITEVHTTLSPKPEGSNCTNPPSSEFSLSKFSFSKGSDILSDDLDLVRTPNPTSTGSTSMDFNFLGHEIRPNAPALHAHHGTSYGYVTSSSGPFVPSEHAIHATPRASGGGGIIGDALVQYSAQDAFALPPYLQAHLDETYAASNLIFRDNYYQDASGGGREGNVYFQVMAIHPTANAPGRTPPTILGSSSAENRHRRRHGSRSDSEEDSDKENRENPEKEPKNKSKKAKRGKSSSTTTPPSASATKSSKSSKSNNNDNKRAKSSSNKNKARPLPLRKRPYEGKENGKKQNKTTSTTTATTTQNKKSSSELAPPVLVPPPTATATATTTVTPSIPPSIPPSIIPPPPTMMYLPIQMADISKQKNRVTCKCAKSKCLKLYCDCFRQGKICHNRCSCHNCKNTLGQSAPGGARYKAINETLMRRPDAFEKREKRTGMGCACRKNKCLKKYCDCFSIGVFCDNDKCRCDNCRNFPGGKDLSDDEDDVDIGGEAGVLAEKGGAGGLLPFVEPPTSYIEVPFAAVVCGSGGAFGPVAPTSSSDVGSSTDRRGKADIPEGKNNNNFMIPDSATYNMLGFGSPTPKFECAQNQVEEV